MAATTSPVAYILDAITYPARLKTFDRPPRAIRGIIIRLVTVF
jgi:hypothetical protein